MSQSDAPAPKASVTKPRILSARRVTLLVFFERHDFASGHRRERFIDVRLGPGQIVILLDGTFRESFIEELTSGIFDRRILATRDKGL